MVLFNHSTRELTAKIVYYGPGLCGKTTNLKVLHDRLEKGTAGRLLSLATAQDRTIYFDLLPVELGNIKGYTVRFQLCTVPGQVFYNETRKLVLRGVDGLVFIVDSQWSMLSHNLESFQNLRENLKELEHSPETLPVVIQYNKRDLPGILSVEALQESLNFQPYPFVEAVASQGKGVVETFKLVSKLTFVDLLRRLQKGGGLETDTLTSRTSGEVADPGEETIARPRSKAVHRTSFIEDRQEATQSPFETTGTIPPPAPSENVFGEPFAPEPPAPFAAAALETPPSVFPLATTTQQIPFLAMGRVPSEAVDSEPVAFPEPPSAPEPAPAAPAADFGPELEALKDRVESLAASGSTREFLDALREDVFQRIEEARREIREASAPFETAVADITARLAAQAEKHETTLTGAREASSRELGALRSELLAMRREIPVTAISREELERVRSEQGAALEAHRAELASLAERLESERVSGSDALQMMRTDLELARASVAEAVGSLRGDAGREVEVLRAEMKRLDEALSRAEARREESRGELEGRLGTLTSELSRLNEELKAAARSAEERASDAERRAEERIAAAEKRSRTLTDSLKRALAELDEPG